jgi:hypothetical protein
VKQQTRRREERTLRPHMGPTESWATLCPDSDVAFVGDGALDWFCPRCGESVDDRVTRLAPILDNRLVKHPSYSGSLQIEDTPAVAQES